MLNLWESENLIGNGLTCCLREPGGPCVKPMGIRKSCREWVKFLSKKMIIHVEKRGMRSTIDSDVILTLKYRVLHK